MARLLKTAIRLVAAAVSAAALAAAAGLLPFGPVWGVAAAATAFLAGEAFLAARSGPDRIKRTSGAAVIDSSALIDGRLPEIVSTGFLDREILVPAFVLRELQGIADAADPARRARGRRGLDCAQAMAARVIDDDPAEETTVDLKLLAVAKRHGAALVTTDFNLNKLAGVHGVLVLNVNALAHAVRPAVLPGESLRVTIVKDGREPGQGVAYLDDGTMIVVEQGRGLAGSTLDVVVTSAIQTAAGKMLFARPAGGRSP